MVTLASVSGGTFSTSDPVEWGRGHTDRLHFPPVRVRSSSNQFVITAIVGRALLAVTGMIARKRRPSAETSYG